MEQEVLSTKTYPAKVIEVDYGYATAIGVLGLLLLVAAFVFFLLWRGRKHRRRRAREYPAT